MSRVTYLLLQNCKLPLRKYTLSDNPFFTKKLKQLFKDKTLETRYIKEQFHKWTAIADFILIRCFRLNEKCQFRFLIIRQLTSVASKNKLSPTETVTFKQISTNCFYLICNVLKHWSNNCWIHHKKTVLTIFYYIERFKDFQFILIHSE